MTFVFHLATIWRNLPVKEVVNIALESIINGEFVFDGVGGNAFDVEIVDYH